MVCGETEVAASSLRSFIDSLREPVNESGLTVAQQHMKVSELLPTIKILKLDMDAWV